MIIVKMGIAFKSLLIREWDGLNYSDFLNMLLISIKLVLLEELKLKD